MSYNHSRRIVFTLKFGEPAGREYVQNLTGVSSWECWNKQVKAYDRWTTGRRPCSLASLAMHELALMDTFY